MRASLTVTADASALVAEMRRGSEGLREIKREAQAAAAAATLAASEQGRMAAAFNQGFDNFGANRKSARDSAGVFEAAHQFDAFQREQADQAARAYRSIEESLNPLIRAERELAQAQDVVNRALTEGQTSQESAARTLQQLQSRYDGLVRAQNPAARSAQVFEAAIEAEAAEIRNLTLALDPAARAQAEFVRVQEQVNRAVLNGTLAQGEANRVMQLFEARQKAIGKGGVTMGMGVQNAGHQITDIIVQMQGGQAMGLILSQQLPQLLGGFGALGAVLGVVVAMGAPLVTSWLTGGEAAGSLDDRLRKLEGTLSSVRDRLELLDDQDLGETFGNMTGDIREMTQALFELERAAELKQLQKALDGLLRKSITPGFGQQAWEVLSASRADPARSVQEITQANYAKLTKGIGPDYDQFVSRRGEIEARAKAGDIEAVVERTSALISEFANGGPVTNLNDQLLEILTKLGDAAKLTAEIEAWANGSARAEAITNQVDEMVRGYEQQAELSRTALKFGEDSAEVEEVRARQAREALQLRLEEMKAAQDGAEAQRAMAALDADLAASADLRAQARQREADTLLAELDRQGELSSAVLKFGRDSAEVEALRALHAREVNDARLKELGLAPGLLAMSQQLFALEQQRARQIKSNEASQKADQMVADLRAQAEINRAITAHGRDSLQVKELQIAAERRAYAESLKALEVSQERKAQMMAEWEQAKGLASADPFGQVAASREILRNQAERVQQLKLEQALLGQSEATRSRILALWKAEQDIRRQGIDATSERARMIREAAAGEDALTRSIQRQADAWKSVQSAAESTLDGILDKLMEGDWEGALSEMAKNVSAALFDLSVRNPAKNATLGKDLPTMGDIGGLGGIWGLLTGRGDGSDIALPDPISEVATMDVQAATVVIGGPGAMALLGNMPGAANSVAAPGTFSGLGGSTSVQEQAWRFFTAKGLKPHQVAGIMGNIAGESGFNPRAEGDAGEAYGLFQHNDRKGRLFEHIGGKGNLGNVQGQLEFAWQELMTTENAAYKRLMASTDVRGATDAFMRGFERPSEQAMNDSFGARLGAAEAALTKFGSSTQTAATGLGTLGNGFDVFGGFLSGAVQGGGKGALDGLLGGLAPVVAGALGVPGFAAGGDHLGGLRVVGEKGPELEFTGPSRIMNAELTRQLLSSRSASPAANSSAPIDNRPVIQVINNSSAKVTAEVEETTDNRGQRQYRMVMDDAVAGTVEMSGGRTGRAMKSKYGLSQTGVRR